MHVEKQKIRLEIFASWKLLVRDQKSKMGDCQANFSVKMMRVTRVQDVNGLAFPIFSHTREFSKRLHHIHIGNFKKLLS